MISIFLSHRHTSILSHPPPLLGAEQEAWSSLSNRQWLCPRHPTVRHSRGKHSLPCPTFEGPPRQGWGWAAPSGWRQGRVDGRSGATCAATRVPVGETRESTCGLDMDSSCHGGAGGLEWACSGGWLASHFCTFSHALQNPLPECLNCWRMSSLCTVVNKSHFFFCIFLLESV
jgi:hypothetical protein